MSEVYIEPTYQGNNANYSKFQEMHEQQTLMFDVIIGIFGGIIGLQLLFTCYILRTVIHKFCCGRPVRKYGGIVQIGEMSHKIENNNKENLTEG